MPVPDSQRIDAEFVKRWSERYLRHLPEREKKLLGEVGPVVARRGYYLRDEFLEVGKWKSARPGKWMASNRSEDVEYITRIALAAPDHLAHRILGTLAGVKDAMASALLTVADPGRFTVTDFRAIETLRKHGEIDSKQPQYRHYLEVCREIAQRVRTDLRTVDRALWQWSKENGD